jgi:hypothetical protein
VSTASASTHAHSAPQACSVIWDQAHAAAFGTAAAARFWVALEQPGPWGRQAAVESHLDPELGASLDRLCADHGGRFLLIRRPGTHADRRGSATQRVYVAGGLEDRPWLLQADLDFPSQLGALPWAALAAGDLDAVQEAVPELEESSGPVLMVCTNSRRDVCCAVRGRPVALAVGAARPGQVWECSHTGGHRFAPTGVLLPYGQMLARLDVDLAVATLDAAAKGQLPPSVPGPVHDRGRSSLEPPGQAAESVVRQQVGELDLTALSTTCAPDPGDPDAWACVVRHRDGRSWPARVVRQSGPDARPESCGKAPVPTWTWRVDLESAN